MSLQQNIGGDGHFVCENSKNWKILFYLCVCSDRLIYREIWPEEVTKQLPLWPRCLCVHYIRREILALRLKLCENVIQASCNTFTQNDAGKHDEKYLFQYW